MPSAYFSHPLLQPFLSANPPGPIPPVRCLARLRDQYLKDIAVILFQPLHPFRFEPLGLKYNNENENSH